MSESNEQPPRRRRWPWVVAALVVIAIVVVAALASVVMRSSEEQEDGLAALEATSVDESTLPQTLPFRYVAGHVLIDALPGDSTERLNFILDSGAPTTYSDDVADAHGGEAVGQIKEEAIDGSVLDVPIIPVETLSLGGAEFHDAAGTKGFLEPDNPLSCLSDNGLIGASLMKNAVWQLDYEAQEVTIAPTLDGLDHIDGAIALDFTYASPASPSPLVRFGGGDGELVFLLDTGSDGDLTVNPADVEAIGVTVDQDGPAIETIAAGAAGTYDAALTYAGIDLDIGGATVAEYPIATVESLAEGQGNIGNAFLDDFVLTIDWPGGKVYLDPVSADGSIPTPTEPAAVNVGWDGEDMTVGSIARGSPPAEAGLELGETVVAIDETDVGAATRDDFCTWYTSDTPDQYSLTDTAGETFEIGPVEGFYDSLAG